ncbi:MAG TPA: hypothetical protein VK901_20910 [Nitrospiraceae bacterium]|nr:hypothetical protein [Nitrospiraceae bacterium]
MGQKMEPIEPAGGDTMKQTGSGHDLQALPAREQLSTNSCARCAGLLVTEWCYDLINTGAHHLETLRCVQCGHRVDPVILQNQIRPPDECEPGRQMQPRYSIRAGTLCKLV